MTEESCALDQEGLDRDMLYESLIDSVMRLLLHVQDVLAHKSRPQESVTDEDVPGTPTAGGFLTHTLSGGLGGKGMQNGAPAVSEDNGADEELDTNLWGGGNILVRLSSVVGEHLKRASGGGAVGICSATARKSCALLTLLGRMTSWSDAVHWESLLDQVSSIPPLLYSSSLPSIAVVNLLSTLLRRAGSYIQLVAMCCYGISSSTTECNLPQAFWKASPGLLVRMTGSHVAGVQSQGERSSESLSSKEAAADALAALDVV